MIFRLMIFALLAVPGIARAQSFDVHGSAGPTLIDQGYSVAAGIGVSTVSRLTLAFNIERTHLASRLTTDARGFVSGFRGTTMTLGTAALQIVPLGRDRVGPYGLAGLAAGISRPNVTATFPDKVTNDVRAIFFGGGVQVPVGDRGAFFADARWTLGAEGVEGIVAMIPVRAGFSVRF